MRFVNNLENKRIKVESLIFKFKLNINIRDCFKNDFTTQTT